MASFFDADFLRDFTDDFLNTPGIGTQAAYSSFAPQGGSFNQNRFFQSQSGDVMNEFLGVLGNQARSGELPTARFTDFLEDFDFQGRAAAAPPAARGRLQQSFNPPTFFNFR